ncbi:helix-turn-helix transcriptional regulator [Caballeronia glebae]|uniref:helix-turn-helix transcriptional regulator n=1 Tax=Caballeronia glebae TaxID=1777143 RepID=UPI0038BDD51E
MEHDYKVINRNGRAASLDSAKMAYAVKRAFDAINSPRARHCEIRKDLPTEISGAEVAMQSTGADGAPVAASSDDDDDGGGDADPDGKRSPSTSHVLHVLHAAHSSCVPQVPARFLRLGQVKDRTGLSRSTIYQFIKDGKFPPSLSIGARAVAWLESDVDRWIADRVQASFKCAEAA